MKKILLLLLVLFISFSLNGTEILEHETYNDKIIIHYENDAKSLETVGKTITKIFALPFRSAEISINNCSISVFSEDEKYLRSENLRKSDNSHYRIQDRVRISNTFTMRDLHAFQVTIDVSRSQNKKISQVSELDFEIVGRDALPISQKTSAAFKPVYKQYVDNFQESYLQTRNSAQSNMLIICHENVASTMSAFVEWKEAKGIKCHIATIDTIGETNTEIKNYVQGVYDSSDNPPDYLLLVGDVDGDNAIPSFYFSAENDVSDHPYTLLAGSDYFPDLFVGRFSFDSLLELQTMIYKVIYYEKYPYIDDWLERALVVAGNYSSSPPIPTTPVKTSRWLREKMLDNGYSQVDTVFYPPTYPGTGTIVNHINDGVGFVNYRGWGDANGWHYPLFHVSDFSGLNNGQQLPVMTSIVCNTGDFANAVDPCFGEAWLRIGTPQSPRGGVVFMGPSDLHTSTKFNNSICAGMYQGILEEDIYNFAPAVLRGKMEMYNNFPLNQGAGGNVEFYFYVYNILGDPSLTMRTTIPAQIEVELPDEISLGTNYIEVNCSNLSEGVVTAKKDDEFYARTALEDGSVVIFVAPESEGDIVLTITAPNFIPLEEEIEVVTANLNIGLENYTTDDPLVAGNTVDLDVSLKNYGTQTASNVSAELTANSSYITIPTGSVNFGSISAGNSAQEQFQFEIFPSCPDNEIVLFSLEISTGDTAKFEIPISSLVFEIMDYTVPGTGNYLVSGEDNAVSISVLNSCLLDAPSVSAELSSSSSDVEIISSIYDCGDIFAGESAEAEFTVFTHSGIYNGKSIPFTLHLQDLNGLEVDLNFYMEIGPITNSSPTGPDSYGYFAYDSEDKSFSEHPVYEWFEIDPEQGGTGTVIEMVDDFSQSIGLPFDFTYYNTNFDSITICSNGWISFETTWMANFRNWKIPAALGPNAQVCAFWDDLIGEPYTQNDTIYHKNMRICYDYKEDENIFVIEWNDCYNRFDDSSPEKFEIVLYDPSEHTTSDGNGIIQINYRNVSNPDANSNYSTIGIENIHQTDGVLYTYADIYPATATTLRDSLAIRFTTEPPVVKEVDFGADTLFGIPPLTVQFTDESNPISGSIVGWEWNFGDSTSSFEQNPEHTYTDTSLYDVSLKITLDIGRTFTELKRSYINVFSAIYANFGAQPRSAIVPAAITFQDSSVGFTENWFWDFGDDSTSTEHNPTHIYEDYGIYSVGFSAANSDYSDSLFKENFITVYPANDLIWPGDTNYDGYVDEHDIIPIAAFFRESGDGRAATSFSWQGYNYPGDWETPIAVVSDCNGDGSVNIFDALGICLNWHESHEPVIDAPILADSTSFQLYRDNLIEIYHSLDDDYPEFVIKEYIEEIIEIPQLAKEKHLQQNFPNPFLNNTEISYSLGNEFSSAKIIIYNIKGQLVKKFILDDSSMGSVIWDGEDDNDRKVSSGLYFYKLEADQRSINTKRMLLIR